MKLLITGSSGFIGTNLLEHALSEGIEARGIDVVDPQKPSHANCYTRQDILDLDGLLALVREYQPTHVWHMAARTDLVDGEVGKFYPMNTIGTRNLIRAMQSVDTVERCIFASSKLVDVTSETIRDVDECIAETSYGASKLEMERIICKVAGQVRWSWCIVRPTSVWGPWFGVPYFDFFKAILGRYYFQLGDADPLRSFSYVGNFVHQLSALNVAPSSAIDRKTFYLSDYEPYSIRDWSNEIASLAHGGSLVKLPEVLVRFVTLFGDLLTAMGVRRVPLNSFRLKNMRLDTSKVDMKELRSIIGSELPWARKQGVLETLNWIEQSQRELRR